MIWVVLTIVQLPLYVGFQLKSTGAMSIVDLIADIIFWSYGGCGLWFWLRQSVRSVVPCDRFDILLCFNTGYYQWVKNRNHLIMNRKAVFFNYCAPRSALFVCA